MGDRSAFAQPASPSPERDRRSVGLRTSLTTQAAGGWCVSAAIGLLVVTASTACLVRGILPALRQGQDFAPIYCASRLWMLGLNAYDDVRLKEEAARQGITTRIGLPQFPAVYPPLAVISVAPLALLPYPAARAILLLTNVVALVGCWWMISRQVRWQTLERRSVVFGCVVVGFAAVHTCLKDGQLTPIVLFGILTALNPAAGTMRAAVGWSSALFKYSIPAVYVVMALVRWPRRSLRPLTIAGMVFGVAILIVSAPVGSRTSSTTTAAR